MVDDKAPILAYSSGGRPSGWRSWALAVGCGIVIGCLLGVWITAFPGSASAIAVDEDQSMDGYPPVIASGRLMAIIGAVAAGIVVGVVTARAARSHPLPTALAAGVAAAASSVVTIVLWQWHRARWPVGTIDGRMIVVAAALLVLVCSAAALAATAVSHAHRRAA
jgi:hypothetical protein